MTRVVAITGVAGGIGYATAEVFREHGWHVVGIDRRQPANRDPVGDFVAGDVADPEQIAALFAGVEARHGALDALVNNAAVQICKPLRETTLEDWDSVMTSNVRPVFLAYQAAYELLAVRRGAIVNVSSVHAIATSAGIGAYAASKGALLALTRAMALEAGAAGIRVNAVLPGAVDTPMLHAGLARGHVAGRTIEELVRGLGHKHVLGRVGQPKEIGEAILFLADNERSSFLTGQAIVVDGGATARLSTE
ncbi:MAG: SDR family oxidoreductase [Candidatus Schekmanbacteria bacterium]|nr:SDR family oxidoreductase [Candidatus Schekmanbacteria bacterium]